MAIYNKKFYLENAKSSYSSAKEIVPLIVQLFKPISVVDVGCSSGKWLKCFQDIGIDDYLGIDNVNKNQGIELSISKTKFLQHDLKKRINIKRKFDLVLSLEVAEHLPASKADIYIDSLVNLGSIIIFSAAIPYQTGTHHINERWPSYWAKLFSERNFTPFDYFREKIWSNEKIEWWYSQNLLVFVNKDYLKLNPILLKKLGNPIKVPLARIHPKNSSSSRNVKKSERLIHWINYKLGHYA